MEKIANRTLGGVLTGATIGLLTTGDVQTAGIYAGAGFAVTAGCEIVETIVNEVKKTVCSIKSKNTKHLTNDNDAEVVSRNN